MGVLSKVSGYFSKFYSTEGSPPEIFNRRLYFSIFLYGILGAARGYDEGNVAGSMAQPSFIKFSGLGDKTKSASERANLRSNIKSMVLLGSIGGSLIAMYLSDKIGRLRTLQVVCIVWLIGSALQVSAFGLGQLYAGRLIEGLAIGQTVVIGPTYLAEVTPKNIRGLAGCLFAGAVYIGSSIANFANYGTTLHISNDSRLQWVVPTCLKLVIAGLLMIGSFFVYESPRWLMKVGRDEQAIKNLCKIRNLPPDHAFILSEISDIQEYLDLLKAETANISKLQAAKQLFFKKSVRHRFLLGIAVQILGQWSFAGSITMYMPELSALVGITGSKKIMFSGVLGIVKLSAAYISAFFLIDFLGRRKCLYLGVSIQLFFTLYYATFLAIVPNATHDDYVMSASQRQAGVSALAALFLTGVGWAIGWNSIQYLINSEILPLSCRSMGTALIMAFHFACQYGNSKAMPHLLISLKPYGTFYFASAVLIIGLFFCWFFLPEISGRSLESMEEMFNLPWYLIGRRGAQLCPDHSGVSQVRVDHDTGSITVKAEQEFVENKDDASFGSSVDREKQRAQGREEVKEIGVERVSR